MRKIACRQTRQRGVAIVTALLLATLAITLVSSLFWQQQVQVRSIENQRLQLQKEWISLGVLDWAGVILRTGAKGPGNVVYLGQSWNTPLADAGLGQYAADGRANADRDSVAGNIVDAQSRYNLTNLSSNGVINPAEVATFKRLLVNLRLPPDLAVAAATAVAAGQMTSPQANPAMASGTTNGTLPLLHVEDLFALPGVTPGTISRLKNFVVVLPVTTLVNLNTASAEVLAASFESLSLADAASLIASRRVAYFRDAADFASRLPGNAALSAIGSAQVATFSSIYFLVNSKVRVGRTTSNTESLIRSEASRNTVVWSREQ